MIICRYCDFKNPPGQAYCARCSNQLGEKPPSSPSQEELSPFSDDPIESLVVSPPENGKHKILDLTGQKLGNVRLIKKIGHGSYGEIFQGEHLFTKRLLAVKILHTHQKTNKSTVRRFRREALILDTLQHKHIIQFRDFGFLESHGFYLIMEFLVGETLGERLNANGPYRIQDVKTIMQQICSALRYMHDQQIWHRDLKPDNIFLHSDLDGQEIVKLLDFGTASLQATESSLTDGFVGTAKYASPEQVRMDVELDGRSDLYSLGVILYRLLTGELPIESSNPANMIYKILGEPVPPLKEKAPQKDWAPELEKFIQIALAKEPEKRPQNAYAFERVCMEALKKQEQLNLDKLRQTRPEKLSMTLELHPSKLEEFVQDTIAKGGLQYLSQEISGRIGQITDEEYGTQALFKRTSTQEQTFNKQGLYDPRFSDTSPINASWEDQNQPWAPDSDSTGDGKLDESIQSFVEQGKSAPPPFVPDDDDDMDFGRDFSKTSWIPNNFQEFLENKWLVLGAGITLLFLGTIFGALMSGGGKNKAVANKGKTLKVKSRKPSTGAQDPDVNKKSNTRPRVHPFLTRERPRTSPRRRRTYRTRRRTYRRVRKRRYVRKRPRRRVKPKRSAKTPCKNSMHIYLRIRPLSRPSITLRQGQKSRVPGGYCVSPLAGTVIIEQKGYHTCMFKLPGGRPKLNLRLKAEKGSEDDEPAQNYCMR